MAELLHLDLVTPQKRFFSDEVTMVVIPGELGDFAVMAHHAPLVSMIRPGMIEVHDTKSVVTKYFVNGGYANIADNKCIILAESLTPATQLERDAVKAELEALYAELDKADSEVRRTTIQRSIMEVEAKLMITS